MKLLQCYIDDLIKTALMEDINYMDAAADNLIPPEHKSSAYYVAKDSGVVCGIEVAKRVFELVGGDVSFNILMNDGTKVKKGDVIGKALVVDSNGNTVDESNIIALETIEKLSFWEIIKGIVTGR